MAMGTREKRVEQEDLWVAHTELAVAPGHPFYQRLNQILDEEKLEKVFIGSIDQGTTSTRFIIFDGMGEVSLQLHARRIAVTDFRIAGCATPNRVHPTLPPVWLARA